TDSSRADHPRPPLEEDHVAPDAGHLAEPLAHADLAETARVVEPKRGFVLGEDPGLQRPVAGGLGASDELVEQGAADARAARRRSDVDADLADAAVAAPAGDVRQRRPADDGAVALADEPQLGMRRIPRLPVRRLRLEGRVPFADALRVDRADDRPVL